MKYISLIVCISLCSSGCAVLPTSDQARYVAPASDGLGVLSEQKPLNGRRSKSDVRLSNLQPELLLMADESDAKLGEPVNFEKINRVLNICRGC